MISFSLLPSWYKAGQVFFMQVFNIIQNLSTEAYSKPYQTSKMEHFAKIVFRWKFFSSFIPRRPCAFVCVCVCVFVCVYIYPPRSLLLPERLVPRKRSTMLCWGCDTFCQILLSLLQNEALNKQSKGCNASDWMNRLLGLECRM